MHHMSQPNLFIDEVSRVLKPGGVLILVDLVAPRSETLRDLINERVEESIHSIKIF